MFLGKSIFFLRSQRTDELVLFSWDNNCCCFPQIPRDRSAQCQKRARRREEKNPCTVELPRQDNTEQVFIQLGRSKRTKGGGEAQGVSSEGRLCSRFPVHYKQADGRSSGVSVGETWAPVLHPPPERLLRRLRRHGLPGKQGLSCYSGSDVCFGV